MASGSVKSTESKLKIKSGRRTAVSPSVTPTFPGELSTTTAVR